MNTATVDTFRSIAKGHPALLFATLMLGLMAPPLVFTAFAPALPQMARDLGQHGEFVAQMSMALASLGVMLGSLLSGWILEKTGARATMLTGLLAYGAAGAGGLVLRDATLLLATRFVIGFAAACILTTCVWGISAEYRAERRARVLGIATALSQMASFSGIVVGGYLAQRGGWPLSFVTYPVFGAAGFLLTIGSLRQVRPEAAAPGQRTPPFFKRLLPFYLLTVFLFTVIFMAYTQFVFLLDENGIKSPQTRSLIMGNIMVLATLTSFGYGPVQRWLKVRGTFALALFSMAFALAAIGWATSAAVAVLGAGLIGIHIGLLQPYLYHALTERTDPFTRSRAIGLLGAFTYLGGFLNPVVFAPLGRMIGLRNVFFLVALVMAILALAAVATLLRSRNALGAGRQERAVDSTM
jgi:MFS family permease